MVPVRSRVHGAVKGAVPSGVEMKGTVPSTVEMKGTVPSTVEMKGAVPSSVDTVVELFEEYVEAMEERKMKMWGCGGRVRSRLEELEAITRKCSEDQEAITSRFMVQLQEKGITSSTLDSVVTSLHLSVSLKERGATNTTTTQSRRWLDSKHCQPTTGSNCTPCCFSPLRSRP